MNAVLLFSGGLDSRLAWRLLERRGVGVTALHVDTGLLGGSRLAAVERAVTEGGPIQRLDAAARFVPEVVAAPRHGYGAALAPCRDCRIFMLRAAARVADARGIEHLATGEVVGQRGFDQSRAALRETEREAGVAGRVLRPLSPALHGGGRGPQRALAARLGIEAWPQPDGRCCRLADPAFAARMRDAIEHGDPETIGRGALERLRRGRHFRLAWDCKLVVGRDEAESLWLAEHRDSAATLRAEDGRGPFALLEGRRDDAAIADAAAIVARYRGGPAARAIAVRARAEGLDRSVVADAASAERLAAARL